MSNQLDKEKKFKKKPANFIGYFKNLMNARPKTVSEAKKIRNEFLKLFFISIGLALVPSLIKGLVFRFSGYQEGTVYNIINVILILPTVIGYIGFLVFGICLFIANKNLGKMKDLECPNCKQQIDNAESVEYSILKTWVKEEKSIQNDKVHVFQIEKALVSISCVCQNCGQTKKFEKEFNTAKYVNGNMQFQKDVSEYVGEMFGVKKGK